MPPRHRPNRLPPPPPRRHHPTLSPKRRESALAHVQRIHRERREAEGPAFDPEKRGTWHGSSRDLVVNPRHHQNESDQRQHFKDLRQGKFYDIEVDDGALPANVPYRRCSPARDGEWWASDYTGGSDYSGSSVERSNYRELLRFARELDAHCYVTAYGAHGTFQIFWRVGETPEEILDVLDGLEDYPAVDDSALSEQELEDQEENWKSWAERDFRLALEKKFGGSADEVSDEALREAFDEAAEESGTYWESQGSTGDMYIDIQRLMKMIKDPPPGFVED